MALPNEMQDFNILVSCISNRERNAALEAEDLISSLTGDHSVEAEATGIRSLLVVRTSLEPRDVIRKLKVAAIEDPWRFQYTLKYIPIDIVVETDIESIAEASRKIIPRIASDETFRITCNKRHSQSHCKDIIRSVAALVEREVDLENPDKVIQVEIVGRRTGLAVIGRDDTLSLFAP